MRRIGEELGVRYAVEGSARKLSDMLRVSVQLVSTETNTHVWAGRFDQNVKDLADGQEEIVSRLRAVLDVQVFDAESARSVQERTDNPDVFDLLLRARSVRSDRSVPQALAQPCVLYEQALQLDPLSVSSHVRSVRSPNRQIRDPRLPGLAATRSLSNEPRP